MLDLEATGSGKHGSHAQDEDIVEVGLSLIDTQDLAEVDSFSSLVVPRDETWANMKPVVVDMHKQSGLYDEIEKAREFSASRHTPAVVDADIAEWLKGIVGTNTTHIPYAGSGVCHYDRKFIREYFPKLDSRITHWSYDIGGVERMFRLAGQPWPPNNNRKAHRALDDARFHADEFRWFIELVKGLSIDG